VWVFNGMLDNARAETPLLPDMRARSSSSNSSNSASVNMLSIIFSGWVVASILHFETQYASVCFGGTVWARCGAVHRRIVEGGSERRWRVLGSSTCPRTCPRRRKLSRFAYITLVLTWCWQPMHGALMQHQRCAPEPAASCCSTRHGESLCPVLLSRAVAPRARPLALARLSKQAGWRPDPAPAELGRGRVLVAQGAAQQLTHFLSTLQDLCLTLTTLSVHPKGGQGQVECNLFLSYRIQCVQ